MHLSAIDTVREIPYDVEYQNGAIDYFNLTGQTSEYMLYKDIYI